MSKSKISVPTVAQIKDRHEAAFPGRYFFSRDTMKFFKDTISNFRTRRLADGRVLMYRAKQRHRFFEAGTGYIFDETTAELKPYKEEVREHGMTKLGGCVSCYLKSQEDKV